MNETPDESGSPSAQRVQAASMLMRDREHVMRAVASRLGDGEVVFESSIRGSSMWPAIPGHARLQVRRMAGQHCGPGDIAFYRGNSGFVVHRIAYQPLRGPGAGHAIAFGDNCLTPDQPLRNDQILGTVIAFRAADGWRAPGAVLVRGTCRRLVRAVSLGTVIGSLWVSVSVARRMARTLAACESALRVPLGRLLRRLRPEPTDR